MKSFPKINCCKLHKLCSTIKLKKVRKEGKRDRRQDNTTNHQFSSLIEAILQVNKSRDELGGGYLNTFFVDAALN